LLIGQRIITILPGGVVTPQAFSQAFKRKVFIYFSNFSNKATARTSEVAIFAGLP